MQKTPLSLIAPPACLLALGALAAPLTGCGGDSGGGGGTSTESSGGSGGTAASACFDYTGFDGTSPAVQFKVDVLPIFRNSCGLSTSCHGSESGPGGQHYYGPKLSDPEPTAAQIQAIFDQSLDKPAVAEQAMKIIAPGDPEHSFLMHKLDGDPDADEQVSCSLLECEKDNTCLDAMPQNGPRLAADERDKIRRWIAQGAKND